MVRGAGCREINLRIRRREKNVLDIPFYRSGDYTQNPVSECNRDVTPITNRTLQALFLLWAYQPNCKQRIGGRQCRLSATQV